MFFVCLLELSFQRTPPTTHRTHPHTASHSENRMRIRIRIQIRIRMPSPVVRVYVCGHARVCAFIRTPECLPVRIGLPVYWCPCICVCCSVLHISVFTSRFVYFARKQVHGYTHTHGHTHTQTPTIRWEKSIKI